MINNYPTYILTIKRLSKQFGHAQVVKNVKLSLGMGKIYAIIGPNGAGKTTLFNLITGIIPKDEGKIIYFNGGKDSPEKEEINISESKAYVISRFGIGRTFQGNRVFNNMSVLENVMFARQLIEIENPASIIASNKNKRLLKRLKANSVIEKDRDRVKNLEELLEREAEYWLDFVGLKEKGKNKAEDLSYGQQKLLSIARLLMADSRLLLFDEPTAGVNPKYSKRIADIFRKIVEKGDKTILFIEHDMKFIKQLNCKCLYMEEGKCPWPFFELEVIMKNEDIRKKFMGL